MRARSSANLPTVIVPTLRVGMPPVTLCVTHRDAERPWLHSHAERGNDHAHKSVFEIGAFQIDAFGIHRQPILQHVTGMQFDLL